MKISEIYKNKTSLSFETFPPKGDFCDETFNTVMDGLKPLNPDYISVTYSAGGTGNSNKTIDLAGRIKNTYGIEAMAHLTCINSSLDQIKSVVADLKKQNIENILALRGDRMNDVEPVDFHYAQDLIYCIKNEGFCIGAACYPEGHIECDTLEIDLAHLKEKQEAGADFFISQLFFNNDDYYKFLDRAEKAGITVPISAGIMPFLSKAQISRMIFMCGASLPSAIIRLLNKYEDNPEDLKKAGIEYAGLQIINLLENKVDGVHLYTMNQPEIAKFEMEQIKNANL